MSSDVLETVLRRLDMAESRRSAESLRVQELLHKLDRKIDQAAAGVTHVDERVTAVDAKVDVLDGKADALDGKVTETNGRVRELEKWRAVVEALQAAGSWRGVLIVGVATAVVSGITVAAVLAGLGLH